MEDLSRHEPDEMVLGRCPACEEPIAPDRLLIQYRTTEGWPRMFAECPECLDVVHPV